MASVLPDANAQRLETKRGRRRRFAKTGAPANYSGRKPEGPNRVAIAFHDEGNRWVLTNPPDRSRNWRCDESFLDGRKAPITLPSRSEERMGVAIVVDDEKARWFLERIVDQSGEFRCVGSYASGVEAIQEMPIARPAIVLMDIRMPGMSGIESMRRLKSVMPELTVVLASGLSDPETMAEALAAGGDGYLTKPFTISQFLATLTFSLRYHRAEARNGADDEVHSSRGGRGDARLTKRENEVMHRLAKGLLYKEIAGELHISYSAVNKHQHSIYQKLQANNRTEAINNWRGAS